MEKYPSDYGKTDTSSAHHVVLGQMTMYTELNTKITFATQPGAVTWGYALPPSAVTSDATEYIGYIVSNVLEALDFD